MNKNRRFDFFLSLFCLLICCVLFLHGIRDFYPLNPWDEAFYIRSALFPTPEVPLDYAPVYVGFLKLLSLFFSGAIDLYYANIVCQTAMLAIGVYLLATRLGVSSFLSFVLGFFVLTSEINAPIVYSKTSHLNASFFVWTLYFISHLKRPSVQIFVMSVALWISLYLRLENIIVLGLFLLYYFYSMRKISGRRTWWLVLTQVLLAVTFLLGIGSPFGGEKIWLSFADWYHWNRNIKVGFFDLDLVADARTQVFQTLQTAFGKSSNLWDAFVANPWELSRYFLKNSIEFVEHVPFWMAGHFPLTRGFWGLPWWAVSFVEVLIVLALAWGHRKRGSRSIGEFIRQPGMNQLFLLILVGFFLKALLISAVVSPAPRYSLEFVYLLLTFSFVLLQVKTRPVEWRVGLPIILLMAIALPRHTEAIYKQQYANSPDFFFNRTIQQIQGIQPNHHIRMLSSAAVDTYLGNESRSYNGYDYLRNNPDHLSFLQFLDKHEINVVVVDKRIGMNFKYHSRFEELLQFIADSPQNGFQILEKGSYQEHWPLVLMVRQSRLQ